MGDAALHVYWARCDELGAIVDPHRAEHACRHWLLAIVHVLEWARG